MRAEAARKAAEAAGQADAYRSIGSFFSDDVDAMIRGPYTPEEDAALYPLAELPPPCRASDAMLGAAFGRETRESGLFQIEDGWAFLNHGAFGATMEPVMAAAEHFRRQLERQPLRFIDRMMLPLLAAATRRMAAFVHAEPDRVVLLPNVTSGMTAVMQSLTERLSADDAVFVFSTNYGPVKAAAADLCRRSGASLILSKVTFPLPDDAADAIVEQMRTEMPDNTRVAIFDHISSATPFVMPVERLVELCNERGVVSVVDGAHGLASVPLNLSQLQPSFYLSNCHKWLAAAKGCAFMCVRRDEITDDLRPAIISHGFGASFVSKFIWDGTRDYGAQLSLPVAIDFWQRRGADDIRAYMRSLLAQAAQMLTGAWETDCLTPPSVQGPMVCVRLPHYGCTRAMVSDDAVLVQNALHRARIEAPIKCVNGTLYVRISAHIYNYIEEYELLRDTIPSVMRVVAARAP